MRTFKFLSLLFIAVSVGFASCKKDDKEDTTVTSNATLIVGKWKKTKEVETEYNSNGKGPVHTDSTFTSSDYVEYKSNGQCVVSDGFLITLNYQVDGSKITYKYVGVAYGEETIKSINSTQLVTEETDDEGNGTKYVTVTTYTKM